MAVGASQEERERLRELYRPDEVSVLFVAEGPPHAGTFFYRKDAKLYEATIEAFRKSVPGSRTGSFLERFRDLGCYLEDLSLDSVDQWGGEDPRRIAARTAGEAPLAKRITGLKLKQVFIIEVAIEPYVRRALAAAKHDGVPVVVATFPHGGQSATEFRGTLEGPLRGLFTAG